MIPKPPFERDLSLESEIADFERLKGRLGELWTAVFPADDQSYTSVVIPSVHETREPWSNYLEERLRPRLLERIRMGIEDQDARVPERPGCSST